MDYGWVRGFNYQPSFGSTSFENWLYFNHQVFELELRRGKAYFPGMNTVRLWLSWNAYKRNPARNAAHFEQALTVCAALGIQVVPVLFNRWHDSTLDNGGIYLDHMLPGGSWVYSDDLFDRFIADIAAAHREDERILLWDTCNEPFSYGSGFALQSAVEPYEQQWLRKIYRMCKDAGLTQPVSYSPYPMALEKIEAMADISDLFLVHPYYTDLSMAAETQAEYTRMMDGYVDLARRHGKALLTTETCWGAMDDAVRADIVRYTLAEHTRRGMGFIVHALHHSRVADLHGPDDGPVGGPGDLSFIRQDGTLRPGHGVFNEF